MEVPFRIAVLLNIIVFSLSASWDYHSKGPDTWGESFPECSKKSQSPISIKRNLAKIDYDLPHVDRRIFYSPPTKMKIVNNGHSIVVVFNEGAYEINDAKLLPFKAKIVQYHLHWGQNPTSGGSEHTLDEKQYFAELHAVHYNTKYDNISVAIDKSDGLAVFGWFIDVGYPQKNPAFEVLLNLAATGTQLPKEEISVESTFSLETLLPADLSKYYRYKGSLTTPGCYESVVWTMFEEPIQISEEQAQVLSSTFKDNRQIMQNNFRPVQPLNGRIVTRPPPRVSESGAKRMQPSLLMGIICCLSMLTA